MARNRDSNEWTAAGPALKGFRIELQYCPTDFVSADEAADESAALEVYKQRHSILRSRHAPKITRIEE